MRPKQDRSWNSRDHSTIGKALRYYQKRLQAPYAFQVSVQDGYVDADCFACKGEPLSVPARTFLSQLF